MKKVFGEGDVRLRSALLSIDDVKDGSPEKGLMAARQMRILWNSRSHDLDGWRKAIEWMAPPNAAKAWQRLPNDDKPVCVKYFETNGFGN